MYRYFKEIENKVKVVYSIAEQARLTGLDPKSVVEISLATSLAQRTLALISSLYPQVKSEKIEKRIKELEKKYGFLDHCVCLKIAEEIANEKFCKFKSKEEAIDAGLRVAMAYITLGVVASPLEGYTRFVLKKTKDGKDYFCVYFSGPIRSAGGTAAAFYLIIIDYLRELFGYAKYDPTDIEVKRMITEMHDYHDRVTNLQYLPGDEEARMINSNLPIQVDGDPSEKREASNYKDLERIETNRVRNGPCLVLAEGLAQKTFKILKILKKIKSRGFKISSWDWLEDVVKFQKENAEKKKKKATATYIQDAVAGRPIFGHPSWSGAFRLRYGRSRMTGYSAMAIHPATMVVLDNFIALGTQVKLEKPTKAAAMGVCDSIDGPIVKLENDSVLLVNSKEKAEEIKDKIKEIIYIGDLLASYGDFSDRNYPLIPCGYNHEWWLAELKEVAVKYSDPEKLMAKTPAQLEGIQKSLENLDEKIPELYDAVKISILFNIPLHPKFIFYWSQITFEQFFELLKWLDKSEIDKKESKILLPYGSHEQEKFAKAKRALELIGIPHDVATADVVIFKKDAEAFAVNLGTDLTNFNIKNILEKVQEIVQETARERECMKAQELKESASKIAPEKLQELKKTAEEKALGEKQESNEENIQEKDSEIKTLDFINKISKFKIKDKAGTFIGARMGRPEKAKPRELTGSPSVLFPVGEQGGRLRSLNTAVKIGYVEANWPVYWCDSCKCESIYFVCHKCGKKTQKLYVCSKCGKKFKKETCPLHGSESMRSFAQQKIPVRDYFESAKKLLKLDGNTVPALIKGVRGTSSINHTPEHLAKGVLRAKFGLHVNKDGTVRYDASEVPITQFKPKEIGTPVEKLRSLGYTKDVLGRELKKEEQILELKPHDVILPGVGGLDEPADETFFKVANFLDELLVKFYGMKPFYCLKNKKEIIGHLLLCIAPHNCAGVAARIIGFSSIQGLLASPYMHAAVRRDCVYPATNFVYSKGGMIKNEQIGNYVEKLIKQGNKTKPIDSYGTLKIDLDKGKDICAFGVDPESKKLIKKRIKYFIKGKPPEEWVKIKTASGREQITTSRHKFIYLDGNNDFKTKRASEIKTGDRIAVLKNFNLKSAVIDEIFLPKFLTENIPLAKQKEIRIVGAENFFKNLVKKNGKSKIISLLDLNDSFKNLYDWYKLIPLNHIKKLINSNLMSWGEIPKSARIRTVFNNKKWKLNLKINKDLMKILGYYSAEGHSRQTKTVSQVCFRIMEKEQKKRLVSAIKKLFGIRPSFGENETKITICNKLVYYLFKYCFNAGEGAYKKRVPNIVYNVSNELIKVYLSAYFDGDGTIIYREKKVIAFYSVNKGLLDGISLLGAKFGLFSRFSRTKERLPGKKVLERYKELGKIPKKHILHHLIYSGKDFYKLVQILKPAHKRKLKIIKSVQLKKTIERKIKHCNKFLFLEKLGDVVIDIIKEVSLFSEEKNSYCFEVDWKSEADKNVLWGEQIINARCDGDEAAVMLLLDSLLNFSREYLPSHRGATQDTALTLNIRIRPAEVDDMIFNLDIAKNYPLELYMAAEQNLPSNSVKIEQISDRIKSDDIFAPFKNLYYTHEISDINLGASCSIYKSLPTMQEKLNHQMAIAEKLRSVDTSDVARLVIDRHFIRDLKGNFHKFAKQQFRCVKCNEKYRRPPVWGKCLKCGGRIIFTIAEGSVIKYLESARNLANKFNVPDYTKQNIELLKKAIESIFGREKEKQQQLGQWVTKAEKCVG